MPKQEPVERFKISCETDVTSLGPVMSALAKIPGLVITGNELITEIAKYQQKSAHAISSIDFTQAWIADHPTFKAVEVARAFEEDGRNKTTCYPALTALIEKGVLVKNGPGLYARADVKQIAAAPKTKTTRRQGEHKIFAKRGEDVILAYGKRNHGRLNTPKLIELFEKEGRARNSVYASIDALLKKKLVKRVGDSGSGQYILLAASKTPSKPASKAKPPSRPKATPAAAASPAPALNGGEAPNG